MRRLGVFAVTVLLSGTAASCAKSECNADNCGTGCCDGDTCRTEFGNATCSTGGAACVACNTDVELCFPATRSCERFTVVRLAWHSVSETQPLCTPLACSVDARVWEADYPALATTPQYGACLMVPVQVGDATHPEIWSWSSCVSCTEPCCVAPLGASPVDCFFHPDGAI